MPESAPLFLSAAAIAAMPAEKRVHFVNPLAIRYNKSLGDAVGLKNIGVHLITVAPDDYSTEYHVHRYEEECIYVLSGRGMATIGETKQRIGPGDFIGCPCNGVAHEMINDGAEPLVCLVIGQRLPQEIVDYPRRELRLIRHSGVRELVETKNLRKV
ncbi:MAG: cupin domain-containing protein [Betaproteobacteria bacterium]|nr:cupin domain-containing protein [Betaproteobacteria bacterium]